MSPHTASRNIEYRFAASATTYDAHAAIQDTVAGKLIDRMATLPMPERLLEVGCGTGQLTRRLLRLYPDTRIDALDISARMLQTAEERLGRPDQVHWLQSDFMRFAPGHPYPLIASSSSIHWIQPIERALAHVDELLEPGGRAVLSIMLRDTLKELHEAKERVVPHKLSAARLPGFGDVLAAAEQLGWTIEHRSDNIFMREYESGWDFFRCIHRQGLTGGPVSHSASPLTRSELDRLVADYDNNFPTGQGVEATYHLGFLVARKPDASA